MTTGIQRGLIGLLCVFASVQTGFADDKAKKTGLEGTWVAVKKDSRVQQLKFTGQKFEAKINGNVYKGTFKLNNEENPLQIDLKITETPVEKHKGKTALGIYEFQGANLRWCSSQPGRKRRPQRFARQIGDALLLLGTLKMNKKYLDGDIYKFSIFKSTGTKLYEINIDGQKPVLTQP